MKGRIFGLYEIRQDDFQDSYTISTSLRTVESQCLNNASKDASKMAHGFFSVGVCNL
jgi:hypothetical protein